MRWPFSQSVSSDLIVASLGKTHCDLFHFQRQGALALCQRQTVAFSDWDELGRHLEQWIKHLSLKDTPCRWLLNRESYQTLLIDKPEVPEEQIDQAARWLVKDQLDYPPDEVLLQHYQPLGSANRADQIVLVSAQKQLIEKLIEMTKSAGLHLETIGIEELSIGFALLPELKETQITGYIGEDDHGLIFNFYQDQSLTFSRYIRGKQFPKVNEQELSLESDIEEANEAFLLEVQRTLDYAVNQIYRSPVNRFLLQPTTNGENLARLIQEITEVPVSLIEMPVADKRDAQEPPRGQYIAACGLALKEMP